MYNIYIYTDLGCYVPMYNNLVLDKWIKNEGKWFHHLVLKIVVNEYLETLEDL